MAMKDKKSFKMVLQNSERKVYVDFDKGYDHISRELRKLGYDCPFAVRFSSLKVKFTHQDTENLKYLIKIINKYDLIMDVFRGYQYIKFEIGFNEYLSTLIKSNQIHSIKDLLIKGNLYQLYNISKNQDIPKHQKIKIEDMKFQELMIFNKPALFTSYRIDNKDLPKGIYKYECQHDDNQDGIITMIGNTIHVNFLGTILTTKKIGLSNGYKNINLNNDIVFNDLKSITLSDYIGKYPIVKNKHIR